MTSFCLMAAGSTLPLAIILDGHARTDFKVPLDYCKWFPLLWTTLYWRRNPSHWIRQQVPHQHGSRWSYCTTWCITTPAYSFAFQQFLGKATWTWSMSSVSSNIKIGVICQSWKIILTFLLEEHGTSSLLVGLNNIKMQARLVFNLMK